MNEELVKKIIEGVQRLLLTKNRDEILYGNAYIEFTDRKIEVIDPTKIQSKKYIENGKLKLKKGTIHLKK